MAARRVALAVCAVLALSAVALASLDVSPVPLLMWSGKNHFAGSNTQLGGAVQSKDVVCMLRSLYKASSHHPECLSPSMHQHVHSPAATPSAVVAFVFSKLGSEDLSQMSGAYSTSHRGSLENLKHSLENAESQLIAPYVYRAAGAPSVADSLRQLAGSDAKVIQHRVSATSAVAVDSIVNELRAQSSFGTGAKGDLLVIRFDSAEQMSLNDLVIKRVMDVIGERSQGNFVALLTADAAKTVVQTEFPLASHESRAPLSFAESASAASTVSLQSATAAAATNSTGPKYVTSNILLALAVVGFLLLTLFIGVYAMTSVEEPIRFPKRVFHVKKEY